MSGPLHPCSFSHVENSNLNPSIPLLASTAVDIKKQWDLMSFRKSHKGLQGHASINFIDNTTYMLKLRIIIGTIRKRERKDHS